MQMLVLFNAYMHFVCVCVFCITDEHWNTVSVLDKRSHEF